jgi:hypothetical protein
LQPNPIIWDGNTNNKIAHLIEEVQKNALLTIEKTKDKINN